MTFSIVGRCAETGQLGIAISSSSIAVGARCPWVRGGIGAVSTQNITLPALGPEILDLLEQGASASEALDKALTTHGFSQFRQVTVIDHHGATALFTGSEALGLHNALAGEQCVAAGNLLSSPQVIEAMVAAFEGSSGEALADRLLAAMNAAMAAGGEAGPVHSAAMSVVSDLLWPIVDLRVDWAEADPIGELGKLWTAYRPQMQDYITRALDPTKAPSYGVPGDE
ncbi:putative Ntn-hydrolase superfamily protein [Pseudomonas sp. TE3786]